jgi:hypothetical protein
MDDCVWPLFYQIIRFGLGEFIDRVAVKSMKKRLFQ